jgi:hypothetical protein
MPYDGTLDFPVLFLITAMNFIALVYGTAKLAEEGEIISLRGTEEQNVKMIALVFALVEVTPGFLFLWCDPAALPSDVSLSNKRKNTSSLNCYCNICVLFLIICLQCSRYEWSSRCRMEVRVQTITH